MLASYRHRLTSSSPSLDAKSSGASNWSTPASRTRTLYAELARGQGREGAARAEGFRGSVEVVHPKQQSSSSRITPSSHRYVFCVEHPAQTHQAEHPRAALDLEQRVLGRLHAAAREQVRQPALAERRQVGVALQGIGVEREQVRQRRSSLRARRRRLKHVARRHSPRGVGVGAARPFYTRSCCVLGSVRCRERTASPTDVTKAFAMRHAPMPSSPDA